MYLKILFHLYRPTFGRDGFFFFLFQNTVRLLTKRHNTEKEKKKNCIKCAIAMYEHRKQSLRCTNNANKISEISPKKFLVVKLDPPQRFRQIDAPDLSVGVHLNSGEKKVFHLW